MITRLTGPQLFAAAAFLTLTLAMLLAPSSLLAQASQYYHTAGIVLDDGSGNTITLLPPGGTTGSGVISWPTTNAAGVLTNNGSGGLSWVGVSGFTPAYFNAYLPGYLPITVPVGTPVLLPAIGTMSGFTISGSGFVVPATGTYSVEFSVYPISATSFSIIVPGQSTSISQIDCAANSTSHGSAILDLNAGDVIELGNAGFGPVTLSASNFYSVNASMSAMRIK